MLDFLRIEDQPNKKGVREISPNFIIKRTNELMIRGGDFYAIWLEDKGVWSTDVQDAIQAIDNELDRYQEKKYSNLEIESRVLHLWDSKTKMIDAWIKYYRNQMPNNTYHDLDDRIIFANDNVKKKDYSSKHVNYNLERMETPAYDELMSVLYSDEERRKLEWAIGSIINGDSKKIQKFVVLYGASGTGKSTVLNIIQMLFDGYYSTFDAKSLGSSSNVFALESFKENPLVAIQHDGDLSKIEDNTRLNSLVSHELMSVNEKFKSTYTNRFRSFLFMGTNKPVKITDAKSGLIRRLIDVIPTGNLIPIKDYRRLMSQIKFELGGIAWHCKEVYESDPGYYDNYIPEVMIGASNDFYNFVLDSYVEFKKENQVTLKQAWEMYRTYCERANVYSPYSQRVFREELKNYFENFEDRYKLDDGSRPRNVYTGFKVNLFEKNIKGSKRLRKPKIIFSDSIYSVLDKECADCPAQLATKDGIPSKPWSTVKTLLKDINPTKLHYVRVPYNMVVIDFDIPDEDGNKCFEKNLEAAELWPPTYAELSKSGAGIHLHYMYEGDPKTLNPIYGDHIEVKTFTGKSALRRKLTKCNDLPIAILRIGSLPIKEEKDEKKVIDFKQFKTEESIRKYLITKIKQNINKEFRPGTKPSMDFINKILNDAYASGKPYDVSDMYDVLFDFASNSTHQASKCLEILSRLKLKSKDYEDDESLYFDLRSKGLSQGQASIVENIINSENKPLAFFDVEVYKNFSCVCWAYDDETNNVNVILFPNPQDIYNLANANNLAGYNCRRYDNHILYGRLLGYGDEATYDLSKRIIDGDKTAFFSNAYDFSFVDIYDYCSKKQSLKKWEIELKVDHKEMEIPWDQPVPKERWNEIVEYCKNDVLATREVFRHTQGDFIARKILAALTGRKINDTTNSLTTSFIFGNDRNPQSKFNYRNLAEGADHCLFEDEWSCFDKEGRPVFKGYEYNKFKKKSTYRGEETGEGGYVYAEPGMYRDVAVLDVASMHPSSIEAEKLFGPYTKRFSDIKNARIHIKHKEFDKARKMIGGKLAPFLEDESQAKNLSNALKIAINSVYGLTTASFPNPFKDPRNIDNIVAKRGALFMINLKHYVQNKGFTVAHIKTDSIKIPNATPEIIKEVMDYGKEYGYTFEHESTYDRMCLVNDAVFIAKYKDPDECKKMYGYVPEKNGEHLNEWSATGTQFQVPYVFKTLFSKEELKFSDCCETKEVKKGVLYLDFNEKLPDGEHNYQFVGRIGNFCPVKEGQNGGVLYRVQDGKYYAATGTKGYRWMESVVAKNIDADIDYSYYERLADEAVKTISQYCDFNEFVN